MKAIKVRKLRYYNEIKSFRWINKQPFSVSVLAFSKLWRGPTIYRVHELLYFNDWSKNKCVTYLFINIKYYWLSRFEAEFWYQLIKDEMMQFSRIIIPKIQTPSHFYFFYAHTACCDMIKIYYPNKNLPHPVRLSEFRIGRCTSWDKEFLLQHSLNKLLFGLVICYDNNI